MQKQTYGPKIKFLTENYDGPVYKYIYDQQEDLIYFISVNNWWNPPAHNEMMSEIGEPDDTRYGYGVVSEVDGVIPFSGDPQYTSRIKQLHGLIVSDAGEPRDFKQEQLEEAMKEPPTDPMEVAPYPEATPPDNDALPIEEPVEMNQSIGMPPPPENQPMISKVSKNIVYTPYAGRDTATAWIYWGDNDTLYISRGGHHQDMIQDAFDVEKFNLGNFRTGIIDWEPYDELDPVIEDYTREWGWGNYQLEMPAWAWAELEEVLSNGPPGNKGLQVTAAVDWKSFYPKALHYSNDVTHEHQLLAVIMMKNGDVFIARELGYAGHNALYREIRNIYGEDFPKEIFHGYLRDDGVAHGYAVWLPLDDNEWIIFKAKVRAELDRRRSASEVLGSRKKALVEKLGVINYQAYYPSDLEYVSDMEDHLSTYDRSVLPIIVLENDDVWIHNIPGYAGHYDLQTRMWDHYGEGMPEEKIHGYLTSEGTLLAYTSNSTYGIGSPDLSYDEWTLLRPLIQLKLKNLSKITKVAALPFWRKKKFVETDEGLEVNPNYEQTPKGYDWDEEWPTGNRFIYDPQTETWIPAEDEIDHEPWSDDDVEADRQKFLQEYPLDWENNAYYKYSYDPVRDELHVWPVNIGGYPDHYMMFGWFGWDYHGQGRIYPEGEWMEWHERPYKLNDERKEIQKDAALKVEEWIEEYLGLTPKFLTEQEAMTLEYNSGFRSYRDYGVSGIHNWTINPPSESDSWSNNPDMGHGNAWENVNDWLNRDKHRDLPVSDEINGITVSTIRSALNPGMYRVYIWSREQRGEDTQFRDFAELEQALEAHRIVVNNLKEGLNPWAGLEAGLNEWASRIEQEKKKHREPEEEDWTNYVLAVDPVSDDVTISTVELPYQNDLGGRYETMVFGGKYDGEFVWSLDPTTALQAHDNAVEAIRAGRHPFNHSEVTTSRLSVQEDASDIKVEVSEIPGKSKTLFKPGSSAFRNFQRKFHKCFAYLDGRLFFGERHHAAIIYMLINEHGYTIEDLMNMPQAFGWILVFPEKGFIRPSVHFTSDQVHIDDKAAWEAHAALERYFGTPLYIGNMTEGVESWDKARYERKYGPNIQEKDWLTLETELIEIKD